MPIIAAPKEMKKVKCKVDISEEALKEIEDYMQWSGVSDLSFFFEESARFVLSKDKEWKKNKKTKK